MASQNPECTRASRGKILGSHWASKVTLFTIVIGPCDTRDCLLDAWRRGWDALFGTFHRHDFRQPLNLGIHEFGDAHYKHCGQAIFEPIGDAWRLLAGKKTP